MHAHLRGSKSLLTLYQIKIKPDFPSIADEIAEPHPDMNIKVTAFTVSEKSSNKAFIFRVTMFALANYRSMAWPSHLAALSRS